MTAAADLPRVSLLLPNYNNARVLERVLACLSEHTDYPDVEVVAVDDGSTDASPQILERWRDSGTFRGDIQLLDKPNSGAIDTLNTALHAATGELCVQLDADAAIETPGWLRRMTDLMLTDDRVGVVTAKVVMDTGELHACGVNIVGPSGMHDRCSTPIESDGRRRWHHRVDRPNEGEGGRIEHEPAEVDAGIGCCSMYRRADALAVGGYDTGFSPVWFDDLDLCLSIRALGRKAFYLPDVKLTHYIRGRGPIIKGLKRWRPARVSRALIRRTTKQLLAPDTRANIERRFNTDLELHFDEVQQSRMIHHYAYWREKWGWDPINPDVDAIRERWGDTEVCWSLDPERRAAGAQILDAYRRSRSEAAA